MIFRGIIAILFAILALFWTQDTLRILVILLGVYILIDGLISIFGSIGAKVDHGQWWLYLLRGIVEIIVAILVFSWPAITLAILVYLVAIWAIVSGIVELCVAPKMGPDAAGKSILITIGIISLLFGIIVLFLPGASLIVITWLIGLYALVAGIALIAFGSQLKRA